MAGLGPRPANFDESVVGPRGRFSIENEQTRLNRIWNDPKDKDGRRARYLQGKQTAAFSAGDDAGRKLRLEKKFRDAILAPTQALLKRDFKNVVLRFPVPDVAEGQAGPGPYADSRATIAAATPRVLPNQPVPNDIPQPGDTDFATAKTCAETTTEKSDLINILLRQPTIRALYTQLADVTFNTKIGDTMAGVAGSGAGNLNLIADTKPFGDMTEVGGVPKGMARFISLLDCCYDDRKAYDCTAQEKAFFAYTTPVDPSKDCVDRLVAELEEYKYTPPVPPDQKCAELAAAAATQAQAPGAAPNAAAGGGAGQAGQGGGYSRQSRQSRRRGRGKGHSSRGSRRH